MEEDKMAAEWYWSDNYAMCNTWYAW